MLRRSRALQALILSQTASVMIRNPAHNDPDQMSHDTANTDHITKHCCSGAKHAYKVAPKKFWLIIKIQYIDFIMHM